MGIELEQPCSSNPERKKKKNQTTLNLDAPRDEINNRYKSCFYCPLPVHVSGSPHLRPSLPLPFLWESVSSSPDGVFTFYGQLDSIEQLIEHRSWLNECGRFRVDLRKLIQLL